jgi:serine/threonine protein kinase
VVHNDLKPDNILIAHDGRAVISDFGVSRVHPNKSDTSVGSPGTPTYTAPEVWGVGSYAAIPSDVWSLGVTLHAMVFGCLPYFGASQMELIELVTNPKEWECSHACDDAELLALLRGIMQKVPGARARRSPSMQVLTTAPSPFPTGARRARDARPAYKCSPRRPHPSPQVPGARATLAQVHQSPWAAAAISLRAATSNWAKIEVDEAELRAAVISGHVSNFRRTKHGTLLKHTEDTEGEVSASDEH